MPPSVIVMVSAPVVPAIVNVASVTVSVTGARPVKSIACVRPPCTSVLMTTVAPPLTPAISCVTLMLAKEPPNVTS